MLCLKTIAKNTSGFSGADLENVLNEAALLAARENCREIKIYHIDEAIDRVMMGPAKKSRKYSDKNHININIPQTRISYNANFIKF